MFGSAYRTMKSMNFLSKFINACERASRQYFRHILLVVTSLTIEEKGWLSGIIYSESHIVLTRTRIAENQPF